jgi:hypothetical protein
VFFSKEVPPEARVIVMLILSQCYTGIGGLGRSQEHEIGGYEGLYIWQNGCLRHTPDTCQKSRKRDSVNM